VFTPDRAYLLVGWPRTGSSVLAEALTATGVLGRPQEYFWRLVENRHAEELGVSMPLDDHYDLYLDRALRFGTTPNGVFAAKMFWAHAEDFVRRTGVVDDFAYLSPLERFAAPFGPDLRAVFVRRNCLRAAISLWRAETSEVWGLRPGDTPPPAPTDIDLWRVSRLHAEHHGADVGWPAILDALGIPTMVVRYDDISTNLRDVANCIAGFVGERLRSEQLPTTATYVRQADEATDRFVELWQQRTGGCDRCRSPELAR